MAARKISRNGNVYYDSPSPSKRTKRWVKVGFQATEAEHKRIEEDASVAGLSVSAYLKKLWADDRAHRGLPAE